MNPSLQAILEEEDDDVVIRVALIGDGGVGKSSLVSHLCADLSDRGGLYTPTVGCDVEVLAIQDIDSNETFYVELWDFGGNPYYAPARSKLYEKCDGFIFVWDADAVHTFHSLEGWLSEVLRNKGGFMDSEEGNTGDEHGDSVDGVDIDDIETGPLHVEEEQAPLEPLRQNKDSQVNSQQVRKAPSSSSSRRYPRSSSGNKLSSAKYSSGTLDSIMNSQRASVPYGRREESDLFSGSSSILHSLMNRKQHTVNHARLKGPYQADDESENGETNDGVLSYIKSLFGGWIRTVDTDTEKQKVEHDELLPPQSSSPKRIHPSSPSMQVDRIRSDSLVVQYGIQSPEKMRDEFDDDVSSVMKEGAEEESEMDTDANTETGDERSEHASSNNLFGQGQVDSEGVAIAAVPQKGAIATPPLLPTGLSRRRGPPQPQRQEQYHRRESTSNRPRGFSFPHGGLPLMIVANKVDKVSRRDLRSLRTTCSNHVFTSAKFESYMDEKPFYDFFKEIKRVYKI